MQCVTTDTMVSHSNSWSSEETHLNTQSRDEKTTKIHALNGESENTNIPDGIYHTSFYDVYADSSSSAAQHSNYNRGFSSQQPPKRNAVTLPYHGEVFIPTHQDEDSEQVTHRMPDHPRSGETFCADVHYGRRR